MAISGEDITESLLCELMLSRGYWNQLKYTVERSAIEQMAQADGDDATLKAKRIYDSTKAALVLIESEITRLSRVHSPEKHIHFDT
jgi:hypothetical protein